MKKLFAILLCLTSIIARGQVTDSLWPPVVYYKRDSSANTINYYNAFGFSAHKYISRIIIDSSNWWLWKIEPTFNGQKQYTYFKIYVIQQITDGGWDDLVGRSEKHYFRTSKLLPGCKEMDTIPEAQTVVTYNDSTQEVIYYKEYYIGGFLYGEHVKTVLDHKEKYKP